MSSEKATNSPGLCPVKGQKLSLGTQTESRIYLSSLSLCVTKTSPPYPMLVNQTTSNPSSCILPRKSRQTWRHYVRHTRITLTLKTCVSFLYLFFILALKPYSKSCQKYKTLLLHLLLLTGLHFLGVRFVTSLNLNVCTVVTRQNTLPILEQPHAQDTLTLYPNVFLTGMHQLLIINSYWSYPCLRENTAVDKRNFSNPPKFAGLSRDLKKVSSSNKHNVLPVQLLSSLASVIELLWCSVGNVFRYLQWHQLSWDVSCLSSVSSDTPEYLKLGFDPFHPLHYEFFITPSFESIVSVTCNNLKWTISTNENKQERQCKV